MTDKRRDGRSDDRKADTRRKIQLGGLLVKAGLDQEDKTVLLGALTLAKRMLNDPARRDAMLKIGSREMEPDKI